MINIVNFEKSIGKIKPMHAVNNGPVYNLNSNSINTNLYTYRDAGIPYARTHDASFCAAYGGEHSVDISAIFPCFDNDEYLEESYDFTLTDEYIKVIELSGAKVFYRLGYTIEHWPEKYNIFPPKDFKKWAVICEHIIRHYNEGWADGFYYNIEFWEIWNEPDLSCDDYQYSPTWQAPREVYFELYNIVATHLKKCFPNLKIGGPASAGNLVWCEDFFKQLKAPLDFFSWHRYAYDPLFVAETAKNVRELLKKYGYGDALSINNEWNYMRGWTDEDRNYSLKTRMNLKGSSFIAATMCASQYEAVDMLMYYDAAPSSYNGMFADHLYYKCLKGYYPFKMFNELYKLGTAADVLMEADIFACAAKSKTFAAIMLTHFNDDENTPKKHIEIKIKGISYKAKICYYLLDEANDMQLVKEESFDNNTVSLDLELYSSYLLIISKEDF